MQRKIFSVITFFLITISAYANYEITEQKLQNHVNFLSSDSLEGRLTGTAGEKIATEYIVKFFSQLGLEPAGDNGTFFQEFNFSAEVLSGKNHVAKQKTILHGHNVLATLKVNSAAKSFIVISAHVDHLGHGNLSGSLARDNEIGMIHPGADDNASGVATILETAAKLSYLKAQGKLSGNKNILFAAWSGEELGVLGSSCFVKNFKKGIANKNLHSAIDANINLDMVGHLRKYLVLQGIGSSPDWIKIINKIKRNHTIPLLITQNDPYLPTDSINFYLYGVPTLNLFTGAHENYHTPRDKPETLNYEGIKNVSDFLVRVILTLEEESKSMIYHATPKPHDSTKRAFKIYLGTIPDYTSSNIIGVKISGVAKNSPAEGAGLKQDDIIIELAGKSIHDIYDYTSVLNSLHAGKSVKIIVQRGQSKIPLMIIARHRA